MKIQRRELIKYLKEYDASLVLGKRIGYGTTADVYDLPGTNPPQVLKVMDTRCLSEDDSNTCFCLNERKKMRAYFQNEIKTLQELNGCKYIVPVLDAKEYALDRDTRGSDEKDENRSVFLVRMRKFISLESYMKNVGMSETVLVSMAKDICLALQECEYHGILHRDVKPSNIFVYRRKGKLRFILGDFGICRRLDNLKNVRFTFCGTPAFMAPEMKIKKIKPGCYNSDIFSLGVSLYYLLSGGDFPDYFCETGRKGLAHIPNVSDEFRKIIQKSIQFDPENRYAHAIDMYRDLDRLVTSDKKQVVNNPFFLGAKQALMQGDYQKAIRLSDEGCRKKAPGCRRLLAYCLYHEYRNHANVVNSVKQVLDSLICEGDAIAQYIRATIYYQEGEISAFVDHLRSAAEEGCVIAQYNYGRFLFEGVKKLKLEKNEISGKYFLLQASANGYLPALRYLRRLVEKKQVKIESDELNKLLQDELADYAYREKENIIKYL